MTIGKEIFDRINKIDWFHNCGNRVNNDLSYEIDYVNSWEEASNNFSESSWECTTIEARNELTSFLSNKYRNDYSKWNIITKEAKSFLEKEIAPKINRIKEKNNLDDVFVDCVKWDMLGAIMEYAYKGCKNRPTFFFKYAKNIRMRKFPLRMGRQLASRKVNCILDI